MVKDGHKAVATYDGHGFAVKPYYLTLVSSRRKEAQEFSTVETDTKSKKGEKMCMVANAPVGLC